VGLWIRGKREDVLRMSQGELAEFVEVTRTTVNKWESGKVSAPIPKAVAIHEMARLMREGLRDKQALKDELYRLTRIDVNGLMEDIVQSIGRNDDRSQDAAASQQTEGAAEGDAQEPLTPSCCASATELP